MRHLRHPAFLLLLLSIASRSAFAAAAVQLSPDDLLRLSHPIAGECYLVQPPAERVPGAPGKLFVFAAAFPDDAVTIRLPVPKDGYYSLRSHALLGPWTPGRLGQFKLSAAGVEMPGKYQGWYSAPPDPPYYLRDVEWGVARFSAPEVEVRLELASAGQGRLLLLADMRLETRDPEKLKPEDRQRSEVRGQRQVAASPASPTPKAELSFQTKRIRGLEWTTFVPHVAKPPVIDGKLDDWPTDAEWIVLDGRLVPSRGWAGPAPGSDADLSARVAFAWDERFFYVAAHVRDDERAAKSDSKKWGSPWEHDGLVVLFTPPRWLTESRRSAGVAPLEVVFGLNYHSLGSRPRELPGASRYAVQDTPDGYALEASIELATLGWRPAEVGDRFPFSLILVDHDPSQPSGERFAQYGWNYGPGSAAGKGEARLMGSASAAGELIVEHQEMPPGAPARFVGTADVKRPAVLRAVDVLGQGTGQVVRSYEAGQRFDQPGRFQMTVQLPLNGLGPGSYRLQMRWE